MILGNGTISQVIQDKEDYLFFCRGESNRFRFDQFRGETERLKILQCPKDKMFVYVSGLNIYYSDNEYTTHKKEMEYLVKTSFPNYCIFRIGSVTWGDNPNTLVNYLRNNPDAEVQNVYRYLHTKEELTHWFNMIPSKGQHEMNVTGKMVWVPDLVQMIKNKEI